MSNPTAIDGLVAEARGIRNGIERGCRDEDREPTTDELDRMEQSLDAVDTAKEAHTRNQAVHERSEALERSLVEPDGGDGAGDGAGNPPGAASAAVADAAARNTGGAPAANVQGERGVPGDGRGPESDVNAVPALATPEYRNAFQQYVRGGGIRGLALMPAEARNLLTQGDTAGEAMRNILNVTQADEGGYTVPVDVQAEVLRAVAQSAAIRPIARIIPTAGQIAQFVRVQRASGADAGIYSSGFKGIWVPEQPTATQGEDEPAFGVLNIPVRRLRSITWLTEDMAADSMFDVARLLADDGGPNMALVEDAGFLLGSGVNGQPSGLLNDSDISAVDVSDASTGFVADTIGSATPSEVGTSSVKLLDLQYTVPFQYRRGQSVSFVMHSQTEKKIRQLRDANGVFVWVAGFTDRPNTLLGDAVVNSDQMAQDGTNGNQVIAYGNYSHYGVADRQRLTVRVLIETRADEELIGVRLNARVGGAVLNPDAFAIGTV